MRRTILPFIVAAALVACSSEAGMIVELDSDPDLTVECRTQPTASHGECGGWAVTVLEAIPADRPRSDRLLLRGPMGPGMPPESCAAEFVGFLGLSVSTFPVDCWVPSGG